MCASTISNQAPCAKSRPFIGAWLIASGYAEPEMRKFRGRTKKISSVQAARQLPGRANDSPHRRSNDALIFSGIVLFRIDIGERPFVRRSR